MKLHKILLGMAMTAALATGASAQKETVQAQMTCKLTNTAAHAAIFEGACLVKQTLRADGRSVFEVDMGSGAPLLFAGIKGQSNWMHGPERVHFTDLPNGGIFHWGTFALVIAD